MQRAAVIFPNIHLKALKKTKSRLGYPASSVTDLEIGCLIITVSVRYCNFNYSLSGVVRA